MNKIQLTHVEIQMAEAVGKMRTKACSGFQSTVKMTNDNDYLGACGEIAFANYMDTDWDWRNKKYGDGGIDFTLNNKTIDVKCTRGDDQFRRLMVVEGKVSADVYVHTVHDEMIEGLISVVGWETGFLVKDTPAVKPRGFYKFNHIIEPGELPQMENLWPWLLEE